MNYYDKETICCFCNKNVKKINQIVCTKCHKGLTRGLL